MNKQKETHSYSFDINEEILIGRWLDNTVVNFGTNYDAAELIHEVTCWKKRIIIKGLVLRLNLLGRFSSKINGVDKDDWWASKYSTKIMAKMVLVNIYKNTGYESNKLLDNL